MYSLCICRCIKELDPNLLSNVTKCKENQPGWMSQKRELPHEEIDLVDYDVRKNHHFLGICLSFLILIAFEDLTAFCAYSSVT